MYVELRQIDAKCRFGCTEYIKASGLMTNVMRYVIIHIHENYYDYYVFFYILQFAYIRK